MAHCRRKYSHCYPQSNEAVAHSLETGCFVPAIGTGARQPNATETTTTNNANEPPKLREVDPIMSVMIRILVRIFD